MYGECANNYLQQLTFFLKPKHKLFTCPTGWNPEVGGSIPLRCPLEAYIAMYPYLTWWRLRTDKYKHSWFIFISLRDFLLDLQIFPFGLVCLTARTQLEEKGRNCYKPKVVNEQFVWIWDLIYEHWVLPCISPLFININFTRKIVHPLIWSGPHQWQLSLPAM